MRPTGREIDVSDVAPLNTLFPNVVTLAGMTIEVSAVAPLNAESSTVVSWLFGANVTDASFVVPLKA